MTSTRIKLVLVVEDDELVPLSDQQSVDDRVKGLLEKIHRHYADYIQNPFTNLEGPIKSERFTTNVEAEVQAFNRTSYTNSN